MFILGFLFTIIEVALIIVWDFIRYVLPVLAVCFIIFLIYLAIDEKINKKKKKDKNKNKKK